MDGRSVLIDLARATVDRRDPLWSNLRVDAPLGLLAIELATRRRLRVNGVVSAVTEAAVEVAVREYHHFPGGKEEIALAALERLTARLRPALEALRDDRPPAAKLDALLDAIDDLYDGGRIACLLERLCASVDRRRFAEPLEAAFHGLLGAFDGLCREAGLERGDARARAEDAVVRIEGSLVLSAGTEDPRVFQRALESIRATLLAPTGESRPRMRSR